MEAASTNTKFLVCSCCASRFPAVVTDDNNLKDAAADNEITTIDIKVNNIEISSPTNNFSNCDNAALEVSDCPQGNNSVWKKEISIGEPKRPTIATEEQCDSTAEIILDGGHGSGESIDEELKKNDTYPLDQDDLQACQVPSSDAQSGGQSNNKENVSPSLKPFKLPAFNKEKLPEILSTLFEYPSVLRKEKTLLFNNKDCEDLTFCNVCEIALFNLYSMFRDFMELLKSDGKVSKILRRVVGNNTEPLMPILVYDDNDGQSESGCDYTRSYGNSQRTRPPRRLKRTGINAKEGMKKPVQKTGSKLVTLRRKILKSNKRMTARQKTLCAAIEARDQSEEAINTRSSTGKSDCSGSDNDNRESDEDFDPNHVDDDSNDPTFIPRIAKNSAELKRRGRKPQRDNTATSAECTASDSECTSATNKKKRIRNLKKEFWIDKAKNDPSRTCDICGKAFLYARMMQHHKSTVHEGKKPFECEYCGKGFTQNFILKKHTCDYRLAGGDREFLRISREEQLFKWVCDVCGKRFKERSSLAVHQKNHTGETYPCDKCDKTFRRPDHLKTHVKIVHSDEKRFVCTTCGQRFKTSSNLRAHERKHANPDQKHLCSICGKSIKTLSQMGRHQKTHEDVLPFECHICGKRFKMKDYLGQHLRKGKSCAMRVNRKSGTSYESNPVSDEAQEFNQIINFPVPDPQPIMDYSSGAVLPANVDYQYALPTGHGDCEMLTNL